MPGRARAPGRAVSANWAARPESPAGSSPQRRSSATAGTAQDWKGRGRHRCPGSASSLHVLPADLLGAQLFYVPAATRSARCPPPPFSPLQPVNHTLPPKHTHSHSHSHAHMLVYWRWKAPRMRASRYSALTLSALPHHLGLLPGPGREGQEAAVSRASGQRGQETVRINSVRHWQTVGWRVVDRRGRVSACSGRESEGWEAKGVCQGMATELGWLAGWRRRRC